MSRQMYDSPYYSSPHGRQSPTTVRSPPLHISGSAPGSPMDTLVARLRSELDAARHENEELQSQLSEQFHSTQAALRASREEVRALSNASKRMDASLSSDCGHDVEIQYLRDHINKIEAQLATKDRLAEQEKARLQTAQDTATHHQQHATDLDARAQAAEMRASKLQHELIDAHHQIDLKQRELDSQAERLRQTEADSSSAARETERLKENLDQTLDLLDKKQRELQQAHSLALVQLEETEYRRLLDRVRTLQEEVTLSNSQSQSQQALIAKQTEELAAASTRASEYERDAETAAQNLAAERDSTSSMRRVIIDLETDLDSRRSELLQTKAALQEEQAQRQVDLAHRQGAEEGWRRRCETAESRLADLAAVQVDRRVEALQSPVRQASPPPTQRRSASDYTSPFPSSPPWTPDSGTYYSAIAGNSTMDMSALDSSAVKAEMTSLRVSYARLEAEAEILRERLRSDGVGGSVENASSERAAIAEVRCDNLERLNDELRHDNANLRRIADDATAAQAAAEARSEAARNEAENLRRADVAARDRTIQLVRDLDEAREAQNNAARAAAMSPSSSPNTAITRLRSELASVDRERADAIVRADAAELRTASLEAELRASTRTASAVSAAEQQLAMSNVQASCARQELTAALEAEATLQGKLSSANAAIAAARETEQKLRQELSQSARQNETLRGEVEVNRIAAARTAERVSEVESELSSVRAQHRAMIASGQILSASTNGVVPTSLSTADDKVRAEELEERCASLQSALAEALASQQVAEARFKDAETKHSESLSIATAARSPEKDAAQSIAASDIAALQKRVHELEEAKVTLVQQKEASESKLRERIDVLIVQREQAAAELQSTAQETTTRVSSLQEAMRQRAESAEAEADRLRGELTSAQKSLDAANGVEENANFMVQEVQRLRDEILRLEKAGKEKVASIRSLKDEIGAERSKTAKATADLARVQAKLKDVDFENKQLMAESKRNKSEKMEKTNELHDECNRGSQLFKERDDLQSTKDLLEARCEAEAERYRECSRELADVQASKLALDERVAVLERQLEQARDVSTEASECAHTTTARVADLEAEADRLRPLADRMEASQRELAASTSRAEALQKSVDALHKEMAELSTKHTQELLEIQRRLSEANATVSTLRTRAELSEGEVRDLQTKLRAGEAQTHSLSKEQERAIKDLTDRLASSEKAESAAVANFESAKASLDEQTSVASATKADLEKALAKTVDAEAKATALQTELDQVRGEAEKSAGDVGAAKQSVLSLTRELEDVTSELEALRTSVAASTTASSEAKEATLRAERAEAERDRLKSSCDELRETITQTNATCEATIAKLTSERKVAVEQAHTSKIELAETKGRLAVLESDAEKVVKFRETHSAKDKAVEERLTTCLNDLAAARSRVNRLEEDLTKSQSELMQASGDLKACKSKVVEMQTELGDAASKAETDLRESQTALASAKSRIALLESDLASTKEDLTEVQRGQSTAVSSLEVEVETLKAALKDADVAGTKAELLAKTNELSTKTAEYEQVRSARDKAVATKEKTIAKLEEEAHSAAVEQASLLAEVATLRDELASVKKQLNAAQDTKDTLAATHATSQSAVDDMRQALEASRAELTESKSKLASLQSALDAANRDVNEAQSVFAAKDTELAVRKDTINSLKAELESFDERCKMLQVATDEQQIDIAEANEACKASEARAREAEKKVIGLEAKVAALETVASSASTSAAGGGEALAAVRAELNSSLKEVQRLESQRQIDADSAAAMEQSMTENAQGWAKCKADLKAANREVKGARGAIEKLQKEKLELSQQLTQAMGDKVDAATAGTGAPVAAVAGDTAGDDTSGPGPIAENGSSADSSALQARIVELEAQVSVLEKKVAVALKAESEVLRKMLPSGWKMSRDKASGRVFYWHPETNKRQWTHPDPVMAAKPATSVDNTPTKKAADGPAP